MTLQSTFASSLVFLLFACAQPAAKKETAAEKPADTKFVPTAKAKADEIVSPYQQELNKALADPAIDPYYKEIYRSEKLIFTDENKMLSIPKELFTKDADKDLFFFIVFTKSMNGSDGFYSEALGLSALEFVTGKTEWFADYFNIAPKLNNHDMDNWAKYVYGEIQISRENEEGKAVKELESQLLQNCKGKRKEYEAVIKKFIEKVKRRLP